VAEAWFAGVRGFALYCWQWAVAVCAESRGEEGPREKAGEAMASKRDARAGGWMSCPKCGRTTRAGWKHCVYCGAQLGGCLACGAPRQHVPGEAFCHACGAPLEPQMDAPTVPLEG
jgi:Double zinc ribbon